MDYNRESVMAQIWATPSRRSTTEYNREGVMAQIWVAFGQGTGTVRVKHEAALKLRDLYLAAISDEVLAAWPDQAVQVLERIRTIGRLSATKAAGRGDTAVTAEDVTQSAATVHRQSRTPFCPP